MALVMMISWWCGTGMREFSVTVIGTSPRSLAAVQ
jgi:hypothetical protein